MHLQSNLIATAKTFVYKVKTKWENNKLNNSVIKSIDEFISIEYNCYTF